PATYWSLCGLTRNCPASMGQQSVRAASRKTSPAITAGRGGSQASLLTAEGSEDDTRTPSGEQEERGRGPELGDREQEPGGERERGRGGNAQRLLQGQDEKPFPHAKTPGREQGEKP